MKPSDYRNPTEIMQRRDSGANSLLVWWSKVKDLGIPVPRTEVVEIPPEVVSALIADNFASAIKEHAQRLEAAADRIGYPLFMRTDEASGKHEWNETCYVEKKEDLLEHIYNLLLWCACADLTGLKSSAIVFREFIEMDYSFKAFLGMPIARERRYFVKDGRVVCHHSYWPEEAIVFWRNPEPNDWRITLAKLNEEAADEVALLTGYAEKVSAALPGYWSVDFCHAKDGRWILIDMALGVDSFHPECDKKEAI